MNKQNDKYANIIIRTIKKYIFLKNKEYGDTGLGKWLIICNNNKKVTAKELLFLGNIVGVTGWKIWKENRNTIYSKNTYCICVYCGINEKILFTEKQYKWILNVGNKLLKSKFLSQISIQKSIYFKENLKTRNNIYSHNSNNISMIKLDFNVNYNDYFIDDKNISLNLYNNNNINNTMITYNTIQEIGYLIGMPYVNFNGCSNIPDDAADGVISISGKATIIEMENRPPLLIFTGLCPGFYYNIKGENNTKSIYVLNLVTLKPTKKSYLQIELPIELKNLIKSEMSKK